MRSQLNLASSSPSASDAQPYRGFIDRMDETAIEGWAVNVEQPSNSLEVELLVEDAVVARSTTEHDRADLSGYLGEKARPGFGFDAAAMDSLRRFHRAVPNGRLRVRVVGRHLILRSVAGMPTLAEFFGMEDAQTNRASGAHDLLARMSQHRAEIAQKLQQPFRPLPDQRIGFVEAVMPDRDHVWLVGWMRRGQSTEQPVVVLDRQKIPGALAFYQFDRDDLPADSSGFIALLVSEWLPRPGTHAFIFLGDGLRHHLEILRPLTVLDGSAFADRLDERLPSAFGGNVRILQHILAGGESWSIVRSAGGFAAAAAIDRLFVLPHFGVVAEGWVLCPSKRSVSLALRFGNCVLGCDTASVQRKQRNDLLAAANNVSGVVERAGFVAAFVGLLPVAELRQPVFKVFYEDGTSSNHAVDPGVVTRLSPTATLEAALALFPALVSEPFFDAFARGLVEDIAPVTRSWFGHKIAPARRVIVVTVPRAVSDVFLLFAELTRFAYARSPGPVGVVFLGEQNQSRGLVTQLFAQLRASGDIIGSLFFLEDADYALYAVPAILVAVTAEAFAFVGRPAVLTEAGWHTALATLTTAEKLGLTLLGIEDPVMPGLCAVSPNCFAWNRWNFVDWMADQPIQLGGAGSLPLPVAEILDMPAAARLTMPLTLSNEMRAVNAVAAARAP